MQCHTSDRQRLAVARTEGRGHPVRNSIGGSADHVCGALYIATGHCECAMSEQIANGKSVGARKRGKGSSGVSQIMQSTVGDTRLLPQTAPRLLGSADG